MMMMLMTALLSWDAGQEQEREMEREKEAELRGRRLMQVRENRKELKQKNTDATN